MENPSIDELRGELASLEAKATRLSLMRNHLHHQIDFGFETSTTRDREREVSDERRHLHGRIEALRELLRTKQGV